jgi:DNA-binding transcriptional LysR family regulator
MNLQQLHTFCAVIKEGSMTSAAQKLFLTQPAVSQQIRQLEEDLGVELLVRGSRKTKATPQGALLYDYASRIIQLAKQAELSIQSMGAEVAGTLRVGTLNSIGLHMVSPVFSIFLKNNSTVSLTLSYGDGSDMLKALEAEEIDVAILPDAEAEFGGAPLNKEAEFIGRDEMWLVASSKDARYPNRITLRDYTSRPVVALGDEFPGFNHVLEKELKKSGVVIRPVFESSNVGSLKRIVESGLGWGFLPAHSIKKQVQTNRMKRVLIEDFQYPMNLVCYYSKSQRNMKTVEVFLNILKQQNGLD